MRRQVFWATAMALTSALGVMSARGLLRSPGSGGPGSRGTGTCRADGATIRPRPQEHRCPRRSDRYVLRLDGPVCVFDGRRLHVSPFEGPVFNRDAFAVATPRIQRARQMIVMMNTINKTYFAGQTKVTCFTCHRAAYSPETAPRFTLQYGTPPEEPNMINFVDDPRVDDGKILVKGPGRRSSAPAGFRRLQSFTGNGTADGSDTRLHGSPVEVVGKVPNLRTTIVLMDYGDNVRFYLRHQRLFRRPPMRRCRSNR